MAYFAGIDGGCTKTHCVIGSDEGAGINTSLEKKIPELPDAADMNRLAEILRSGEVELGKLHAIPVLVFQQALEGDIASHNIPIQMGRTLGENASDCTPRKNQ